MPANQRPMPYDFAAKAREFDRSMSKLIRHYGAGSNAVARWMKEAGIPTLKVVKRSPPADFAQIAPTMVMSALLVHYRADDATVKRWVSETGISPKARGNGGKRGAPAPEDFAQVAPTMGIVALAEHYGISHKTIKRWINETGIQAKPCNRRPSTNKAKQNVSRILPRQIVQTRISTIYEEAADTLRRERFPVNRCDDRGRFDPKGKFWRVGWSILNNDELLQRAARYRKAA